MNATDFRPYLIVKDCEKIASVLRLVSAIDPDDLGTDELRTGLSAVLEPAAATLLKLASDLADCLILGPEPAERLHTLARQHTQGNVFVAFARALDALEATEAEARAIHETPEAQRARYVRVRDLAQSWVDEIDRADTNEEAPAA